MTLMQEQKTADPAPVEKKKPLLTIRPVFDKNLAMIEAIPVTAVSVILVTAGLATFLYILLYILGVGKYIPGGAYYSVFFWLSLALSPAVYYEIKRRAFARTVCHFYDTYLEFQDFRYFLNRRRRRVRYSDISDIAQNASVLEGLCHLATVSIFIPSMGYSSAETFTGIKLRGIPDQSEIAMRIADIVHTGARQAA